MKRSLHIWPLLLLLLLSACAKPLPHPRPMQDALLQRLEQIRGAFTSVKGLAKATYRLEDQSNSASQVVLAREPKALRLETLSPFGSPMMMLATDGETTTVLLPGEARAFQGTTDTGILQQLLHLPLQQQDLVALLLYKPLDLSWTSAHLDYEDDGVSRLTLDNPYGLSQVFVFNRALQLVQCEYRLAGIPQLQVGYDDFDQKQGYPHRIELQLPQEKVGVQLKFSSAKVNTDLPDQKFALTLPDGYSVEPLPSN